MKMQLYIVLNIYLFSKYVSYVLFLCILKYLLNTLLDILLLEVLIIYILSTGYCIFSNNV